MPKEQQTIWDRMRALPPCVGVGNDTPCWTKTRRTLYGAVLDGSYFGTPRALTFEGALKQAERLSAVIKQTEEAGQ